MSTPQSELVLDHMREFGAITPLEALREYGCFRLGARIYDLKRKGHRIETETVEADGKRFARYSLIGNHSNASA